MRIHVIIDWAILPEEGPAPAPQAELELPENATIAQVLEAAGCGWADLSHYYPLSGVFTYNEALLPYVITAAGAAYDVRFDAARMADFFTTHQITDGTLRVTAGLPWAGGPGFLELSQIWAQIEPYLQTANLLLGLGMGAGSIIGWLRNRCRKEKKPPHACFDLLFSRKQWNHFELAQILGVTPEEAQQLLRLFAFRYDAKVMQYVQTPRTGEMRQKLLDIQVLDI